MMKWVLKRLSTHLGRLVRGRGLTAALALAFAPAFALGLARALEAAELGISQLLGEVQGNGVYQD